ncbi:hypothetical protein K503DRAFT_702953 [Rhizopogon vinicolor AM-OR11-026]|uniref:F-box domain-containing protein n=1 Tax=Rhizopogon vinicolor AM-OR11-026 TaxID=1314800 RepID=A0A1B7MH33_9AGAM|nr:hypothetical protein K503DRAFT_702953 [Rhizopogon vinicolor AM-OR11-026]
MQSYNAITKKKQDLGRILDKSKGRYYLNSDNDYVSKERPQNDLFIEWIYEIDLDRNIYHVNGIPFFDLECLPDSNAFIEYISKDHYGLVACSPACPPKNRYKRPAPPVVDNSDVVTYHSLACTSTQAALSDLLPISDVLSPDEHVRVSLLETLVGQCMTRPRIASAIYELGLVSSHDQLTDNLWLVACAMANFAFVPQIFDAGVISHPPLKRKEFTWVRDDTVVCISTHLDDERCLQACLSRLINAILEQKDNPGDYFGVAFSIFHCVIVKVVKDARSTMFSHTAALEFLPSFFADSPSTPGITTLARLGYRIDPTLFVRFVEIFRQPGTGEGEDEKSQATDDSPPNTSCAVLPLELWCEVALNLQLPDLLTFGLASKLYREIASMVLRYPHVCGYRLVSVAKEKPKSLLRQYVFLRAACFSAVRASVPATVLVGLQNNKWLTGSMSVPFYCAKSPLSVHVAEIQPEGTKENLVEDEGDEEGDEDEDEDEDEDGDGDGDDGDEWNFSDS